MRIWNSGSSVVNCFQISIFAVANTTSKSGFSPADLLWIAFKLVSLQLQTQLKAPSICLLIVVNCFQISIFAVANTTIRCVQILGSRLWIAFKLVSLQLQTQQVRNSIWETCVVNCFQISIFAVANTTAKNNKNRKKWLWIAFKLVSLQLQTQQTTFSEEVRVCCELLSN